MRNIKQAFTLAELLIAMMIFAMLAVMLVPKVTNNAEKELFATQLKKVQNDLQQAMLFIKTQNQGSLQYFCSGGVNPNKCFIGLKNVPAENRNGITKKLEYNVIFGYGAGEDVSDDSICNGTAVNRADKKNAQGQACGYKERDPIYMNKTSCNLPVHSGDFYAVNLKNGATVSVIFDPNCGGTTIVEGNHPDDNCGYMEVDVNGNKIPNMVGKDIHYFWIDKNDGIIPFGEIDNFTCGIVDAYGHITTKPAKDNNVAHQLGCTYRMLQKNKPDYF